MRNEHGSQPAARKAAQQILIVGGGAGGLELATRLGNKYGKRGTAQIELIDRSRTHLWKPLLHEVAAGSMDLGLHLNPKHRYVRGTALRLAGWHCGMGSTELLNDHRLAVVGRPYEKQVRHTGPFREIQEIIHRSQRCLGARIAHPSVSADTPNSRIRLLLGRPADACVQMGVRLPHDHSSTGSMRSHGC